MADPKNKSIHGMNPQFLLEQILRSRIYQCTYWKEKCFALTSETIIDRAIELKYIGGTFGHGMQTPTDFICLILKLLQIQPGDDILMEYLNNTDYKYLRALAAFYIRMTNKTKDVYLKLEQHLSDYRKLRIRNLDGSFAIVHMDEFLDDLLYKESMFGISFPILTKRVVLEQNNDLGPRISILEADLDLDETDNLQTLPSEDYNNIPFTNDDEYEESASDEDYGNDNKSQNSDKSDNLGNNGGDKDYKENFNFLKRSRQDVENEKSKGRADKDERWKKADDFEEFNDDKGDQFSCKKRNRNESIEDKVAEREKVEEFSVEYWNLKRAKIGLPLLPTNAPASSSTKNQQREQHYPEKDKQSKIVEEFSVEYWNIKRAKIGLPLLPTGN